MGVKDFEHYHGVVLTKILRSDRPVSLVLTETRPVEVWSAYELNTEVILYVKHSAHPHRIRGERRAWYWNFTFNTKQLRQIADLRKRRPVWAAFVCGWRQIGKGPTEVCLLNSDQLVEVLGMGGKATQWVKVELKPGKRLRVSSSILDRGDSLVIPRDRLERWQIPGS